MPFTELEFNQMQDLLDEKVRELHILYNVGTIIAGSMRLPDLFTALWPFLKREFALEAMTVTEASTGDNFNNVLFTTLPLDNHMIPIGGASGAVFESRRPLFIENTSSCHSFLHFPGEPRHDRSSLICVPLKNSSGVVGVLTAERTDGIFKPEETDLVVMVGMLVTLGIEKCRLFEKTEELSLRDGLTGLFNHRVFMEKLDEESKRRVRSGSPLSFVMFDIDNFKRINDTYGHKAGDTVLAELASVMSAHVRNSPTDILARYGGEEFSLLLAETGLECALVVAERIRSAIASHHFSIMGHNPQERPTVSVGVATVSDNSDRGAELASIADLALYYSKGTGKNRTSFAKDGQIVNYTPKAKSEGGSNGKRDLEEAEECL